MGRYLWYSNSPTSGTGYGSQTNQVCTRLLRDGHQLAIAANYGVAGAVMGWNNIPLLPQGFDQYSNDVLRPHYDVWSREAPTTLLGLYDTWVIQTPPLKDVPNIAWWTPVDHDPAPAQVVKFFQETSALPIAMSRFGQERLKAAGLPDVRYIPHAIDRTIHRPTGTLENGQVTRDALRVPDNAHLVITTAANKGAWPPRKAFSEMFLAMGRFMAAHDDVYWYVHTDHTNSTSGVDLMALARAVKIPDDRIRWADRYAYVIGQISESDVAALHTAADVMLMTSMGEGFGVPQIEAMAANTPVIASNATAQREIVDGVGWLVDGQPWWDHLHAAFLHTPYVDGIVAALEESYAERGTEAATERAARAGARAAEYDADTIFETMWRPLLAELDARAVRATTRSGPVNTAIRPKKRKRAA